MNRRNLQRLVGVGVFVAVAAAYLWARSVELPMLRAPDGRYVLPDPDSHMRWRLVQRALAGEGVRIRWMTEDNAPYGRLNEWTSPVTIFGVALVRAGEFFGGLSRERALEWGKLWVGPIVGLLSLAVLGWLGWRAGGWPMSACWMVAWAALEDVIAITRFGNTDHHSLHQLLFICMVGGCLAWTRNPTSVGGVFVGAASALGMWSAGSELLPAWLLVAGLAVWELMRAGGGRAGARPSKRPTESAMQPRTLAGFWRGWWVSGFLGTTAAWLFEFWPHVFHGRLEFISVWHVSLWVICGALLEYVARSRGSATLQTLLAIGTAIGLAVVVAGAVRGFDWAHLHVMQDARFQRQIAVTWEFESFAKGGLEQTLQQTWWKYGLLPLLLLGLMHSFRALHLRARWLVLTAAGFLLLILYQLRWADFFAPALVLCVGLAVRNRWSMRPWLCVGLVAVATLPAWWMSFRIYKNVKLVGGDSMRGPHLETFALSAASRCLGTTNHSPVVLVAWDQGATLAGMGAVRVIGSAYWSNLDGLQDTFELFTTPSAERFWQLVRQRQIEFLILPSAQRLERAVWQSFMALHGRAPTRQEAFGAFIWQVAQSDQRKIVPCDPLTRLAPGWGIARVSEPIQGEGSR